MNEYQLAVLQEIAKIAARMQVLYSRAKFLELQYFQNNISGLTDESVGNKYPDRVKADFVNVMSAIQSIITLLEADSAARLQNMAKIISSPGWSDPL